MSSADEKLGDVMRARRTDSNHADILAAIRRDLGWECMSLHMLGKGIEDILVAVPDLWVATFASSPKKVREKTWVLLEAKVPERESTGYYRYTPAQLRWRELTKGWPRITAVSAEDAVAQLREWRR